MAGVVNAGGGDVRKSTNDNPNRKENTRTTPITFGEMYENAVNSNAVYRGEATSRSSNVSTPTTPVNQSTSTQQVRPTNEVKPTESNRMYVDPNNKVNATEQRPGIPGKVTPSQQEDNSLRDQNRSISNENRNMEPVNKRNNAIPTQNITPSRNNSGIMTLSIRIRDKI